MISPRHRMLRIALASLNDIEEWRLGDESLARAKGYPREYPADVIDDWGIVFVDLVLDAATGRPVCHEVNGPNAVGSDALTGDSHRRAASEARQALRRARERGYLGADGRLARPSSPCTRTSTGRRSGPAASSSLEWTTSPSGCRSVWAAATCACAAPASPSATRRLPSCWATCRRWPRTSASMPPTGWSIGAGPSSSSAIRTCCPSSCGRARWPPSTRALDLRVFHAWRLVRLILDKGRQQDLLEGTGVERLPYFEARTADEARARARSFLARGPVVLKPNGASGGAGVHVVVPGMSDAEIAARVDAVLADCVAKYGDNAEATAFPVRGFQFVRSTGYPMPDGDHLWDLRIAVEFSPGRAEVYPVSMRIAPRPSTRARSISTATSGSPT